MDGTILKQNFQIVLILYDYKKSWKETASTHAALNSFHFD